jgi:hypothetical protein
MSNLNVKALLRGIDDSANEQPPVQPLSEAAQSHVEPRERLFPDLSQPRRVLPFALRSQWDGLSSTTPSIFETWLNLIGAEKQQPAKSLKERYALYLAKGEEVPLKPVSRAEAPFVNLLRLAFSIVTEGLREPLIVTPTESGYWILDGERRWWAFHLIHFLIGGDMWLSIPVTVEQEFSRFRQATTGNRDEWNMIARSRLFALLMMDVLGSEYAFFQYHHAKSDREFYAQVAELNVPPLTLPRLLAGCGVTSKANFVIYRKALQLPDEDWIQADEEGWSAARIQSRFNALNPKKPVRKSSEKLTTKIGAVVEKRTEFQKVFERDSRKPEKRAALAQQLDELEGWLQKMRQQIGTSSL